MSSVSSVSSSTDTLSLVDLLKKAQEEAEAKSSSLLDSSSSSVSAQDILSSTATSYGRKAQGAYGNVSLGSSLGQAAINKALSEISTNSDGKVTFADIIKHREDLETTFSAQVRIDLAERGVSLDTEFTLTMTPEGKIDVSCDDPNAKAAIEEYLAESPDVCEQFGYIQALSNLERARQSPAASTAMWQEARSNTSMMQLSALENFFTDATQSGMNYSSLLASFSGGLDSTENASFYAGLNFTV
ncbi:hypothetical protein LJC46_06525 [Desulfovibrio sp. OttesenSCG-928-G15]|nr:hypothetical protein [Desulfovibrio sp. OttesenSCG-928-G15]